MNDSDSEPVPLAEAALFAPDGENIAAVRRLSHRVVQLGLAFPWGPKTRPYPNAMGKWEL